MGEIQEFVVNGEPLKFQEWPKIYRFAREIIITEKIDGTNACVIISDDGQQIAAQSRSKLITPESDNYGFAKWVQRNKEELLRLGPGYHYGEWWGQGIQRGYDLTEKRFSLFNVSRWWSAHNASIEAHGHRANLSTKCDEISICHVVPILYKFPTMNDFSVDSALMNLKLAGSVASPGYMNPEGVVVFHTASNQMFKKTLDKNDGHKNQTN